MTATATDTARERARERAHYLAGLVWHTGAFVIMNAFFWVMDMTLGADGLNWSYWVTGAWAFALAFHALAYLVEGRRLEERKTQQYFAEELERAPRPE